MNIIIFSERRAMRGLQPPHAAAGRITSASRPKKSVNNTQFVRGEHVIMPDGREGCVLQHKNVLKTSTPLVLISFGWPVMRRWVHPDQLQRVRG